MHYPAVTIKRTQQSPVTVTLPDIVFVCVSRRLVDCHEHSGHVTMMHLLQRLDSVGARWIRQFYQP